MPNKPARRPHRGPTAADFLPGRSNVAGGILKGRVADFGGAAVSGGTTGSAGRMSGSPQRLQNRASGRLVVRQSGQSWDMTLLPWA
ncbi:MAG TPA: hypothetical protein VNT79_15710 [Phycisphaerae bacterium]|nr:hypothetical protein [Phycisphaerae bacterium]